MPRSVDTDIQVQPDGSVLSAEIDIAAASAITLPGNRNNAVNWIEAANGALVAQVIGGRAGTTDSFIFMLAQSDSTPSDNMAAVKAFESDGTLAAVQVTAKDSTTGVLQQKQVIDSLGRSDFIQYSRSLRSISVDAGSSVGGSFSAGFVSPVTVNHNLGRTPIYVGCVLTNVSALNTIVPDITAKSATSFQVSWFASASITMNYVFDWFCIG